MGVAEHLRIGIEEYDARIRTFVPGYEDMVGIAAGALRFVPARSPRVVDLGVGTGALAAACVQVRPDASVIGIDRDPAMLVAARSRLAGSPPADLVEADFLDGPLPACDAFVACLSLHHVATAGAKRAFYARCQRALGPSGILVSADCFPARDPRIAAHQREAWLSHLRRSCTREEAESHFAAWAGEDVYFPLEDELAWLREAGFGPEVLWRMEGFAVIIAIAEPA